jgi:hypothetical protein
MGKKPVVCLAGLFWVGVTLAGCENTGRPGANSNVYNSRPWPGTATARNTPPQQSSGWNGQPKSAGGNAVAASDAPVTPDTSSPAQPGGMRPASDMNTTPGSGPGVPSPSGLQQTAAFPATGMTTGTGTGAAMPPPPSPPASMSSTPAGSPATAGHVSQMIRSSDGMGAGSGTPTTLPSSLEQRSTDLNTAADSPPARGASAGDGMGASRSSGPIALDPPPDVRPRSGQPPATTGEKLPPVSSSAPSDPPATRSTSTGDPGAFPPYMMKNPPPPGM